jgi:hypothetical protein
LLVAGEWQRGGASMWSKLMTVKNGYVAHVWKTTPKA